MAKLPKAAIAAATLSVGSLIAAPLIADFEGKENAPYRDIVGVETVCYGDTQVEMRRYSDAECLDLLDAKVQLYGARVLELSPELAGAPFQLAAATSLAYNIGVAAYGRSTVRRRFAAGDEAGACDAFLMWNKAGGREVRGLTRRRQAERELCLADVVPVAE